MRVIALGLGVSLNHGLQPLGEIILTFGLHRKPSANLWAQFFLVCSSSFGVVVVPMAIVIALMVLLLFLWCYSSFGSSKCHSYFMSLTLF